MYETLGLILMLGAAFGTGLVTIYYDFARKD